jgi:hypothetical protein
LKKNDITYQSRYAPKQIPDFPYYCLSFFEIKSKEKKEKRKNRRKEKSTTVL